MRLYAGYRREEAHFGSVELEPDEFTLPEERRFGFFFARVQLASPEFTVQTDVGYFLRDEDFDLGNALQVGVEC